MKSYTVTIPMAGHVIISVEAEDENSAIEKAFESATIGDIESWDLLKQFSRGNVCYCPHPWEVEVVDEGDYEEREGL